MQRLIVFSLIGFVAQLIDGSLGMGYGMTSGTLLVGFGVAPAVASASVHMAEIMTTAASGISHLRFGNVDKKTALGLAIPGALGAFLGSCLISRVPAGMARPFTALFLFFLGGYLFVRFLVPRGVSALPGGNKPSLRFLVPLGLLAGFADASGGGGWGPIATPALILTKGVEPRRAVGTVDTSEFIVTLSATLGFLLFLGWKEVNGFWVFTLMAGGVVAAPLAAWLVRVAPGRLLGISVGAAILLTNARTLLGTFQVLPDRAIPLVYAGLTLLWALGLVTVWAVGQIKSQGRGSVPPQLTQGRPAYGAMAALKDASDLRDL